MEEQGLRAVVRVVSLGAYMHPLIALFLVLGGAGLVSGTFQGWILALILAFPMAVGLAWATVYEGLYRRQYLRLVEAFSRRGWREALARGKAATPCQRRVLRQAARTAGVEAEAVRFLEAHPLQAWRVWAWSREANAAAAARRRSPFALPR